MTRHVLVTARLGQEPRGFKHERWRLQPRTDRFRRAAVRPRFAPLVVDHDPERASLLARALEEAGASAPVAIARSGDEAIAYLAGSKPFEDRDRTPLPTLVLLNALVKGKSGIEVLTWIRRRSPVPGIPVVVMGGSVTPRDVARAFGGRPSSAVVEPGSFDEVVDMARTLHHYWTSINLALTP